MLNQVIERFKDHSASSIVEVNHREHAWTDNDREKKKVDYFYAYKLKND